MAASSLTFTAVKLPNAAATEPSFNKAIPHPAAVRLPLQFVLTGIVSLLTGIGVLLWRPELLATYHYNQYVIAVTHLFVLGWLASVVMGAMYQLVPVALETTLYSEKIARVHFWIHTAGAVGMVRMFWVWDMKQVGYFGVLFAVGVGMFIYNMVRTLCRIPRWHIVAVAIAASLFWLSFGVLAGLFVAFAKCWNFSPFDPIAQMHAHAHLGMVGFFVQLMIGVSFKLVPMFSLSEVQSQRRTQWAIGLVNVGLLGAFFAILTQSKWKEVFTAVAVGGFVIYAVEIVSIIRARKRKPLDWGLKYFFTALTLLVPVCILAIALSWSRLPRTQLTSQLENLYGFLAIVGVLTFGILGMLYKIVPFLIWYGTYSREIGRSKVPSLADLYSKPLQAIGYWIYVCGLVLTGIGIVSSSEMTVRIGTGVLVASLAVFATNICKILSHWFHPKLESLPVRSSNPGAI